MAVWLLSACSSHYVLTGIERSRFVIDNRYDQSADPQATAILDKYKLKVDSIMSPVIGTAAHDMKVVRPESDLSNLLSDILVWAGKAYDEKPVLGIYNMGGIRAALNKGEVTYGDVLAIAPFENKIAFTTLTGSQLLTLFSQIAAKGGEGVSRGTELVISSKGELLSARLHGNDIDPQAEYRVATIDYLVQGNDGLKVFKEGSRTISPQEEINNTRFIIMDYFKEKTAKGETVSSQVEGRIKIKD